MDRQTRARLAVTAALIACAFVPAFAQKGVKTPETFVANASALGTDAGSSANVTIYIASYTDDKNRTQLQDALKSHGYDAFVTALRKAPEVGYVEMGGRKVALRFARQVDTPKGRTITVVTEKPFYFVGGGAPDAKSRAGFEVGVVQLNVDTVGLGTGTMAPAAKVKVNDANGVEIDDYAETPAKLTTVRKILA